MEIELTNEADAEKLIADLVETGWVLTAYFTRSGRIMLFFRKRKPDESPT